MFFLITLVLVTLCGSTFESHLPEHPQKSYYKSQSSLINEYHTNTTPKSKRLPDLFTHNVKYSYPIRSAKGIQYAPLHTAYERKEETKKEEYSTDMRPTPTSRTTITSMSTNRAYNKEHLEPRIRDEDFKTFSPGVRVTTFVSRSPGHNAIYQNNMPPTQLQPVDMAAKNDKAEEKIKLSIESTKKGMHKITYRRPFPVLQNLPLADPTPMLTLALNPVYAGKNQKHDNELGIDATKSKRQQSSASSKLHRIHLNIARVYSPGQVPMKSPVFVDTYPLPDQAQALLLPGSPLSNKKTVMLPVPMPKSVIYKHI